MLVHPKFDPVALQIGPVAIHWYGLTYLVAFGLFVWLGSLRFFFGCAAISFSISEIRRFALMTSG